MNPALVLWPIGLHALVTLALYVPMSRGRVRAVKDGKAKASDFKLLTREPDESKVFVNAIRNQNETAAIFYAACLTAFVTNGASYLIAVLAWLFLVLKIAHVLVHTGSNSLRIRRPVFMAAYAVLILLWLVVLAHLAGLA
ncbi:MAG: MAPEG family protein [Nitratireductor sp.]|nr:MAPEG family protein [Nitratireductor sp.]MCC0020673.1 MAPEG family protein [Nitratireductor sp.]